MGKTKNLNENSTQLSNKKTKPIIKKQNTSKSHIQDKTISLRHIFENKQIKITFPEIKCKNKKMIASLPIYRRDKSPFTSAFCLPNELTDVSIREQIRCHQYRMSHETLEINLEEILVPKPSARNSYCTICKIRFEDYQDHIQLPEHKKKMRASPANKYIENICQKKKLERFLSNQFHREPQKMEENTQFHDRIFLDSEQTPCKSMGFPSKQFLYETVKSECANKCQKNELSTSGINIDGFLC